MFKYFAYLILFVLAVIQAAFWPINLVLASLVILLTLSQSVSQGLLLAFVSGVFLDLANGSNLGISSGLFLIFTLVFFLYQRRFNYQNPIFLGLFVLISSLIYDRLAFGYFIWQAAVVVSLITALAAFLISGVLVWRPEKGTGIKLRN